MISFAHKAIGTAIAAYLLAQQIECPPVLVPLIAGTAVPAIAGAALLDKSGLVVQVPDSGRHKRQARPTAPAGVPQFEFDRCCTDLANGGLIKIQGPVGNNGVQIDNLPASCMNLASVIDGDAVGGPMPQPCGSACILYDNLSREDYKSLRLLYEDLQKD